MKSYSVKYSNTAEKELEKLDTPMKNRIKKWIQDNLLNCENPRLHGKALTGDLKGNWRYRVGKYRIVADIQDDKVIILVVDVDKRNDIYKKKNFLK